MTGRYDRYLTRRTPSADKIGKRLEIAQQVKTLLDQIEQTATSIRQVLYNADQAAVAVPGYHELAHLQVLCGQVTNRHSRARVLTDNELGAATTQKGA